MAPLRRTSSRRGKGETKMNEQSSEKFVLADTICSLSVRTRLFLRSVGDPCGWGLGSHLDLSSPSPVWLHSIKSRAGVLGRRKLACP
jgi:hypothetical protein